MMAFNRPTLSELISRIFDDITSRLSLTGAVLRRSTLGVLARAFAGAAHLLHGHLAYIARESIPYTAIDSIPDHAATWGLTYNVATFATGNVVLTGTVNGSVLPAGSVLRRSDEVEFTTDADATIASLTATVAVTCSTEGATGNTDAATNLTIVSAVAGINSITTVDGSGLSGGSETETAEQLKTRLLERIQNPPHGGNEADYILWAKEVTGVTRVFVYPNHLGLGTVGLTFLRDGDVSPIPDAGEVATVQAYVDNLRPVTADLTVFAPTAVPLDFTITLTPNTAAVQAAVTSELEDMLLRDAEPGGTIYLSRIREAVSIAAGETDNIVSVPAADVTHASDEIATMGTITWL